MAQENTPPAGAGASADWWRTPLTWIKVGAIAVLAAVLYISFNTGPMSESAKVGELPAFELQTLGGAPFTNADLKGKVTILNFFATWCGPCKMEMPELNRFAQRQDPKQVALIAVSAGGEHRLDIRAFVDQYKVSFPVALEGEMLMASVRSEVLPTTVFIDPDAKVARVVQGMVSEEMLSHEVAHLLERRR